MSKKEKGSSVKNETKNIRKEHELEQFHEEKWFHSTGREGNCRKDSEDTIMNKKGDLSVYRDIGEEMFNRLTDDILSGKLQNFRSGKDLFLHMLFLTDNKFVCCTKEARTFNEYVEHRINNCEKVIFPKTAVVSKPKSTKNNEEYDMSAFMTRTLKSRFKNIDLNKKEDHSMLKKNEKKHLRCNHKNCRKKFKSINGLKYHIKHGHKNPNEVVKGFKCDYPGCKKKYKNHNGLKYHNEHAHKEIENEK